MLTPFPTELPAGDHFVPALSTHMGLPGVIGAHSYVLTYADTGMNAGVLGG